MTLEEKLKTLGYKKYRNYFAKQYNDKVDIQFAVVGSEYNYAVRCTLIETQRDIDDIQIAFNRLKRDLQKLEELE